MREYLFDDGKSIFHYILGFISAAIVPALWLISLIVFHIFLIYEVEEFENPIATLGDVIEFMCGFIAGIMLLIGTGL